MLLYAVVLDNLILSLLLGDDWYLNVSTSGPLRIDICFLRFLAYAPNFVVFFKLRGLARLRALVFCALPILPRPNRLYRIVTGKHLNTNHHQVVMKV